MNMNFHYMPFLTAFAQPEDLDRQVSTYNGSKRNLLSKLRTKNKNEKKITTNGSVMKLLYLVSYIY